jgi:hypothetical protein
MASFRIIFPFLLRPNGNDLELNTVSGVSAQARLSPHLLPNCLSYWSTKYEAPRPDEAANERGGAWFHGENKKCGTVRQCDINAAKARLIDRFGAADFHFRKKDLRTSGNAAARACCRMATNAHLE